MRRIGSAYAIGERIGRGATGDVATGAIHEYGLPSGVTSWSPDDRFLAVLEVTADSGSVRVLAVDIEGGRARVRLGSQPPIVAEITMGSIERLRIADGVELWASFKAVEVEIVPS